MGERTALTDSWIVRVLGCTLPRAEDGVASARFQAVRPAEGLSSAMTDNLLSAMTRAAPELAAELPAVLGGLIPRFLLAIQNEPRMEAHPMTEGTVVHAQDQLLGVADSLNAVLRSARRWEALLDEAEQGDRTLDGMQKTERDAAQQAEYENLVAAYNATRLAALAEEERCMQLVDELAKAFRAAQAAAKP